MTTINPAAAPLDGTETISLCADGKGATLTVAQLRAYSKGGAIGAGAANPPVGRPSVTSLDGTEQAQIFQAPTWGIVSVAQLVGWIVGGATPPLVRPASGRGMSGHPVAPLDGTESIMIGQAGGIKAARLSDIAAFANAA
ncbi:hypothetical protein [Sphingomonas sp. BE137]|uniref:hypothetical protein n=1 Tax=Sphingomonas sp. BE137 TaxID=2817844 RepID=UPI001AEB3C15|nr:hypothetical protein [Sphingomonas sp. BE137]MDR6850351.1 hypothetical protein [Sphingomonas sp. BE137]